MKDFVIVQRNGKKYVQIFFGRETGNRFVVAGSECTKLDLINSDFVRAIYVSLPFWNEARFWGLIQPFATTMKAIKFEYTIATETLVSIRLPFAGFDIATCNEGIDVCVPVDAFVIGAFLWLQQHPIIFLSCLTANGQESFRSRWNLTLEKMAKSRPDPYQES